MSDSHPKSFNPDQFRAAAARAGIPEGDITDLLEALEQMTQARNRLSIVDDSHFDEELQITLREAYEHLDEAMKRILGLQGRYGKEERKHT